MTSRRSFLSVILALFVRKPDLPLTTSKVKYNTCCTGVGFQPKIVMRYTGKTKYDSGFVYAPYIPLQ